MWMQDSATAQQRLIHDLLEFPVTKDLGLVRFLGLWLFFFTLIKKNNLLPCTSLVPRKFPIPFCHLLWIVFSLENQSSPITPSIPLSCPSSFPAKLRSSWISQCRSLHYDPSRLQTLEPVTSLGQQAGGDGSDLNSLRDSPPGTSNENRDICVAAQVRNWMC